MASGHWTTKRYKKPSSKIYQRVQSANKSESLCTNNIIKKTVCQAFFFDNPNFNFKKHNCNIWFFVMQQNFDYYDFKKAQILS